MTSIIISDLMIYFTYTITLSTDSPV